MSDPNRTDAERQRQRAVIWERAMMQGLRNGLEQSQSMNCRWNRHAPDGCQNTGESCLCVCHDKGGDNE